MSLIYRNRWRKQPEIPPPPCEWPVVTVQLPIYNERYVVTRLIRSIVRLDYPREKLHIQVLDDSTDTTARLAFRCVCLLRQRGYRIEYLRRDDRTGFKAGALEYGLQESQAAFIAVFDADFTPEPGFLKESLPFIMQPGIGMVQARWGHLNRGYSLLTRLQAIFLDAHFLIEHPARYFSGRFFNFNGTAGIWRRQAIEDAGGWQHDTLTEDLDLSYRAQLKGWKFIYLPHVIAPAELPTEFNAYRSQQHRWAKGSVQTAIKLVPRIWRAKVPIALRLEAIIHLSSNLGWLLMTVPAFLLIPMLKYQFDHHLRWPIILYLLVFLLSSASVIVYYSLAIKMAHGRCWPHILQVPLLMAFGIGLSMNNGRAVLEGLLRRESPFVRTPKLNALQQSRHRKKTRYRSKPSSLSVLELFLGFYFTFGLIYFVSQRVFLSLPFFLLFIMGFFYLSIGSLRSERSRLF